MIAGAVVGLIGPIGFMLGLRAVTTGVGLRNRAAGFSMMVGLTVYAAASVALSLIVGPGAYTANLEFIVLMFLLPMTGVLQLPYLGKQGRDTGSGTPALA